MAVGEYVPGPIRTLAKGVLGAAIIAAGLVEVAHHYLPEVPDLQAIERCFRDPHKCFGTDTVSTNVFGNFKTINDKLVGSDEVTTFGQGIVTVEGIGHVDYRASWYNKNYPEDPDSVDGTVFLENTPVTESFRPCITTASNYANDVLTTTGLTTAKTGQLNFSVIQGPKGEPEVNVDAGVVAPCDLAIQNTTANIGRYVIKGKQNNGLTHTFEYIGDSLLLSYGAVVSCPAGIINDAAVKEDIKRIAQSYLATSPNTAWRALEGAPIEVELDNPLIGQEALYQQFLATKANLQALRKTLPDSANDTHALDASKFGSFAVENCPSMNSGLQLQAVPDTAK